MGPHERHDTPRFLHGVTLNECGDEGAVHITSWDHALCSDVGVCHMLCAVCAPCCVLCAVCATCCVLCVPMLAYSRGVLGYEVRTVCVPMKCTA